VVIASGLSIGTLFTLFVVPAVYLVFAADHHADSALAGQSIGADPHATGTA
jgi:multidrug efflux pump